MNSYPVDNPIVKAILRGGGGSEHEKMKLAGWHWLATQGYKVIDFEAGGFDVIGIFQNHYNLTRAKDRLLHGRVVLDAKASKGDLVSHFQKRHIPDCDIDGKFSRYANHHYIIAKQGLLKVDAVHDPWGLLEVLPSNEVQITKEAQERAYLEDDNCEGLFKLAARSTAFLGMLLTNPELADQIKKSRAVDFMDEKVAEKAIRQLHDVLLRHRITFETVYGYNPLTGVRGRGRDNLDV